MIIAHVGPPTGRLGGPPGYLHQLKSAASADPQPRHDVRFPETSSGARRPPASPPPRLGLLTRLRRKLIGPKFYRPPASELARPGGVVDRMLRGVAVDLRSETQASLDAAIADADIVFTHDPFAAEDAFARRRGGQQVWMMCHGVTPLALYAVWSWALPEAEWRSLMDYADVSTWIDWELDLWGRVDRLILPCPESGESFRTVDGRFGEVLDRAHFVLSGASVPPFSGPDERRGADPLGLRNGRDRVGLYLGSPEPYRGFDALLAAVDALPRDPHVTIAVAGPDPRKVPAHPVFKALGRVEDVAGLLASVDFLINVNRFSLFDLSTIEAAEAGKPLLLHATGGNRAFERLGAGCVMLRDLQPRTIAEGLTTMAGLDVRSLSALGARSRSCWERELTPRRMWERHLVLYDEASGMR